MASARVVELADAQATARFGAELADWLGPGDVLAIDGPLGAGKTTLVRGLVAALGGDGEAVASPTYTLLHRYEARIPVIHIDAYRLSGPADLAGLGFDELAEGSIAVIEWAERVRASLPASTRWDLVLEHTSGGARRAHLSSPGGKRLRP